jgi:ATP-dependent DNA helicase RecQ
LTALLEEGTTLVISPLIALMKDQIDNLPDRIRPLAIAFNSTLEGVAMHQALEDIVRGKYKLIYAAPERLCQPPFLHALHQSGLTRLVISEAFGALAFRSEGAISKYRIHSLRRCRPRAPVLPLPVHHFLKREGPILHTDGGKDPLLD